MIKSYRDLDVWKLSMELVKEIYEITSKFPREEKYGITSQMRDSSVSIPSNIAEGWGRHSTNQYIHFLSISKGSLYELETQITLSKMIKYIDVNEENNLLIKCETIGKKLSSLMKSLEKRT